MELFKNNHDIEGKKYLNYLGATSINACYGATNALINTLNWISSPNWDGRYGIVVASDLAVYEKGPARCTGGAGAVALLIGPKGKITFNRERCSYMDHKYDFYKPNPSKIFFLFLLRFIISNCRW
jgi:hydroxymethylglutaryl-CoA synthase